MKDTILKIVFIILFIFFFSIPVALGWAHQESKYRESLRCKQEYRRDISEYEKGEKDGDNSTFYIK